MRNMKGFRVNNDIMGGRERESKRPFRASRGRLTELSIQVDTGLGNPSSFFGTNAPLVLASPYSPLKPMAI